MKYKIQNMILLFLILVFFSGSAAAWNAVGVAGEFNSWQTNNCYLKTNLGTVPYWGYTAAVSYSNQFKIQADSWANTWGGGYWITSYTQEWRIPADGGNAQIRGTPNSYVHFCIQNPSAGQTNSSGIMTLSALPVSVTFMTDNSASLSPVGIQQPVHISLTLSGSKSAEENIYIRYTSDNWATHHFVSAVISNTTTYTCSIPAQEKLCTIVYYALTTTLTWSSGNDLDKKPDLMTICYNNKHGANASYTVNRVGSKILDGSSSDWNGTAVSNADVSTISSNEWIWTDKIDDVRTDPGTPENYDISEVRITSDSNYIFFLIKFQDIVSSDEPYIALSLDIDTNSSDSGMTWIGDDADTSLGGSYDLSAASHYAEYNIIIHNTESGSTKIEMFTNSGTWFAPLNPPYNSGAYISADNNILEAAVARSDLKISGNAFVRLSIGSFDNVVGWANTIDTTGDYGTSDLLDTVSIERISAGTNSGVDLFNDDSYSASAWEEDISDGALDFWFDLRFDTAGLIANSSPSSPVNPFPADEATNIGTFHPDLTWSAASDSDGFVTGYLLEMNTSTNFTGTILYRVNIQSTNWQTPSLPDGVTIYWRVRARDNSGALGDYDKIWSFNTPYIPPASPTVPVFTPVMDGVKDALWGSSMSCVSAQSDLPADNAPGFYLSNDSEYLYIGWVMKGDPWEEEGYDKSAHYGWVLETHQDPAGMITDPFLSSPTTVVNWALKPDFWIEAWIKTSMTNFGASFFYQAAGGSWISSSVPSEDIGVKTGQWAEIRLSLHDLGLSLNERLQILNYFRPAEDKPGVSDTAPFDTVSSVYGNSNADPITAKFSYIIRYDLLNIRHLPSSEDVAGFGTMRSPLHPKSSDTVYLYTAVLPAEAFDEGTVFYTTNNWTTIFSSPYSDEKQSGGYSYVFTRIPAFPKGTIVQYVNQFKRNGMITYNYGDDNSSSVTSNFSAAQSGAFSYTVSNSPPSAADVILFSPVLLSSETSCTVYASGASDADGDSLTYSFQWYKNSILQTALSSTDSTPPYTSTADSSNFSAGDLWYCTVSVSDGISSSAVKKSSETAVLLTNWLFLNMSEKNQAVVTNAEFIWFDKYNDVREISDSADFDIQEVHVKTDDKNIYFLIKLQDIVSDDLPAFAVSIGTNAAVSTNIIGDDSDTVLGTNYGSVHQGDINLLFHTVSSHNPDIEYLFPHSDWIQKDNDILHIYPEADVIEAVIPRTNFKITGNRTLRMSFAVFKNITGKASDIDTSYNLSGSDAADTVSIPALSDTNKYYNDADSDMNAYEEDLFDGTLDFWCDFFISSSLRSNTAPSAVSVIFPSNTAVISTLTPSLQWSQSSDPDAGDYAVSYLVEINDIPDFTGSVIYRVNVKTNMWKVPEYLPSGYTNYYWRVRARDRTGALSEAAVNSFKVSVAAPYANTPFDNRNINNFGYLNGIEDADGTVVWYWPASSDTNIIHYYIDIGTSPDSADVISNRQLPNVTSCTITNLQSGLMYFARLRAENDLGIIGPSGSSSDGIYVNKRRMDGDASDWLTGSFSVNQAFVSNDTAVWQDKTNDVRNAVTNLDLLQVQTIADKYNLYFLLKFNHNKGFQDGSHYIQIAVDNSGESRNKALIGRNISSADLYVSSDMPWEYDIKILSGLDTASVCDQTYGNWQAGVYTESTNEGFIECAVPLSKMGGSEKFLGETIRLTIAVFQNDNGNVAAVDGDGTADALDVISDSDTSWDEISDRVINYSLSLTFDQTGNASDFSGNSTSSVPNVYPSSVSSWRWAQNAVIYNMFVDRYENGNTANDPADSSRFGGDFQGLIKDMKYFRDLDINTLYLSPVMEFGGGTTGYGVDYWWKVEDGFGGDSDFKDFLREARNNYLNVVIDWPGTAVGYSQPIRDEHPDWISVYQSPWGGWPEFTVGMAEVQQYLADLKRFWLAKGIRGFREDYAKFDGNPVDDGHQYWQQVEAKVAQTFPDFYNFGEVFDGAYKISSYVWSGAELKGCFDFPMKFSILDWMSGSKDSASFQSDVVSAESSYGDNPIMVSFIDNHDVDRVLRTMNWDSWKVRQGFAFTLTHCIPPKIFYGTETGMDGYRIGDDLDNSPCIDPMKWDFNYTQFGFMKHLIKGRRSFPGLRSDKGSRVWKYASGQWLIYERNYYNDAILVIINQGSSSADAPTGSFTTWASRTWRDWMNWSDYFTTDSSGQFNETITVGGHDVRVLVSREYGGGGFGTASLTGQTEPNAIVGIWNYAKDTVSRVTKADASGHYNLYDIVCKDSGSETFNVQFWAPGYGMKTVTSVTLNDNSTTTLDVSLSPDSESPAAPSGLSIKQGDKMVEIDWDDNTEYDFDSYKIYRSTSAEGPFTLLDTVLRSAYIDHTVQNGTAYFYKIRSKDRNGNLSGFSRIVKVVPNPIAVTFWIDVKDSGIQHIKQVLLSGNSEKMGFWGKLNPNLEMTDAGNDWWKVTVNLDPRLNIQYKFLIQDDDGNEIWESGFSGEYSYYNNRYFSLYNPEEGKLDLVHKWNQGGLAAPRPPYGIVLSPGDQSAAVGWNNINTEPNLDHYTIYRSSDGSSFSAAAETGRDLGKYNDTGLINGTTYWYYLTVTDKYGKVSSPSATNTVVPNTNDTIAPVAVSGLRIAAESTNVLRIFWGANVEADLAGYNIYRSYQSNTGYIKLNSSLITPSENPIWYDETVTAGTNYYYKVEAADFSGNTGISSNFIQAYIVKVRFTVDMGNIAPASVEMIGLETNIVMRSVNVYQFTYTAGLLADRKYTYKYQYGSTAEQDFTTVSRYRELELHQQKLVILNDDWEELPDIPQNVWAFPWNKRVDVYWDALSSSVEDLLGYNVYWSTNLNLGSFQKYNTEPITDTKISVTGLSNNKMYYFLIKAVDSGNIQLESFPSEIVSSMPHASQPVFFKTMRQPCSDKKDFFMNQKEYDISFLLSGYRRNESNRGENHDH